MRLISASVLALLLSSAAVLAAPPSPASSPVKPSVLEEASWLSYYRFLSAHPTLSGDALLPVLADGRRIRLEAAASALAGSIADRPEEGMRELDAALDAAAREGHDACAAFAPLLSALRARALDADAPSRSRLEASADALAARLDSTPEADPASAVPSGYLAWLAARCGSEDDAPAPDAEYLKAFPDAPWNLGLLKFRGDLHYFARDFDKAIDLYRRAIAKGEPSTASAAADRYSPFFESEVRRRIGQCHLVCDRFDSAAVELTRAASLSAPPESAVSRLLAAHGLIRAKSPDAALPLLQTALREGGGDGAPLPDAIVNSLKVQEALAWRAKGDPKKILALLSDLAQSPDPAFLFPSDRKMTWRLLEQASRVTGDTVAAESWKARAESEPPLSMTQKADPLTERYAEYVDRESGPPARIAFVFPDITGMDALFPDKVHIKSIAGTTTRLRCAVMIFDADGLPFNGSGTLVVPDAEQDPSTQGLYHLSLSGEPGTKVLEVIATGTESGAVARGEIIIRHIGFKLRSLRFENANSLRLHFTDSNGNGFHDSGEPLSDGSEDPTTRDQAESFVSDKYLLARDSKVGVVCRLAETPADDFKADIRSRFDGKIILSTDSGTHEFPQLLVPGYASIEHEFRCKDIDGLAKKIGVFDIAIRCDLHVLSAQGATIAKFETGASTQKCYVGSNRLPGENAYLCLIEHAVKFAPAKDGDGRSVLKSLHDSLPTLANDLGARLSFDPSAADDDHYRMHVGRLLDRGSGNAHAWSMAFAAMASFLDQDVATDTFEFRNFGGPVIECLNDTPGLGESSIPSSPFHLWKKTFPGMPREKRGDFSRDQPRAWRPLRRHSFVVDRAANPRDLYDPSFANQPFSFQKGIFERPTTRATAEDVPEFVERYLLKLSPNILFRNVGCYNASGRTELLDLARPSADLVTRTAEIVFTLREDTSVDSSSLMTEKHDASSVSAPATAPEELKADSADTDEKAGDDDRPPLPDTPETTELKEIIRAAEAATTPPEYLAILTRLKAFYDKYPGSDYRSFVVYMSVRLMHLGIANKEYRDRFHIPGWWHGDKEFQDLKTKLMTGENRKLFDWLLWSTTDTINFDGWADTAFMLGQYARTAGDFETAVDYLSTFNDPKYKDMHPWILASLGEACANLANQKPEMRSEAIEYRMKYLLTYGGQDGLDDLTVNVLFAVASDLLFEKRYAEAESVLISNVNHFPSHPAAPGLLILLAHTLAVKDSPDFAQAEEVLQAVLELPSSDPDITLGFKPWARLVLARMYMRAGEPEKTVELSERFEKLLRDRKPDEKHDKNPAAGFHAIWEKTQLAGVLVQKALAQNSLGKFDDSLGIVARLERDFKDETTYTKTKFGRPFPPMVLPAWGDDMGDWSDLLHRSRKGGKLDRKPKARIQEAGDLRIRFENPFKTAATFTKAMALWNRAGEGDRDEARKLLNALAKSPKDNRDFLSNTIVGADPFLIAISPQPKDWFKQLAQDFKDGKILADFKVYIDDETNAYDPMKKPYFGKDAKHKFIIKAEGMNGSHVSLENYIVVWEFGKTKKRTTTDGVIDTTTDASGMWKCNVILTSKDGFITLKKSVDYTVFEIQVITPRDPGSEKIDQLLPKSAFEGYAYGFKKVGENEYYCDIKCLLNILPDTEELRSNFKNKINGYLDEISYDNFTVKLTWDHQEKFKDKNGNLQYKGVFQYNEENKYWEVTARYENLPLIPPGSYGRVPYNLTKLLYGKRTAIFGGVNIDDEYKIESNYELYYGENLIVNNYNLINITKFENTIHHLTSEEGNISPLKLEIFEKMICSEETFDFKNINEAKNIFDIRYKIVHNMDNINEGKLKVFYKTHKSNPSKLSSANDCKFIIEDNGVGYWKRGTYWQSYPGNLNFRDNDIFYSINGMSPYDCINNIFAFYGECFGATNIDIILSIANTIGKDKFDKIYNNSNIIVGNFLSGKPEIEEEKNMQLHFYKPIDYDTVLPGDRLYFKNFDNYIIIHPKGGWSGENCIYSGYEDSNSLFSGLGAHRKTYDGLTEILKIEFYNTIAVDINPLGEIKMITETIRRIKIGE